MVEEEDVEEEDVEEEDIEEEDVEEEDVEEEDIEEGRSQVLPVQEAEIQLCCLEYWAEAKETK